jgi:hypothetical protein
LSTRGIYGGAHARRFAVVMRHARHVRDVAIAWAASG